ncbi:MAG: cobalamin biosynthesis protein, partial [Methanobacteriaceae archaeon]|nr:cobalamin biosynthesis protein [Methanobacteriaceae archaeon]
TIFSTMTSIQTYIPNLNDLSWLIEIKNPFTTTRYSYTIVILPVLGGVVYRVINTLDAMVGYENLKYQMIGWFPAKLDDILNFIPSRVTGILIVIAAGLGSLDWKKSWLMMKRDAKKTPSPNSGYPMAAAAGALNVQLEKPGVYILGDEGNQLDHRTIEDAIFLTKITISLFVVVGFIIYISFLYLTI